MDLTGKSTEELRVLKARVEDAIQARKQADVAVAREKVLAIAKAAGMSLQELMRGATGGSGKAPRQHVGKTVPAKYRNPADSTHTWTGRGRQPIWVKDALAAGATLDSLAV